VRNQILSAKNKKFLFSLLVFLVVPLIAFCNKHIIVSYDISKSMKGRPGIERINNYLVELLFKGLPDVLQGDKILLEKKVGFLGKNKRLIDYGDRVSFIKFGEQEIKGPEISIIYDGTWDFEGFFKGILPKGKDFTENWTYLELLYANVGSLSLKYPELIPIRVLISDKAESKPSLNLDEQKKVFWYKKNFSESPILNIQAGEVHLEMVQIIPPKSGIEVISPKPFNTYFKNREIPLKIRVLEKGEPQDKWNAFAILSYNRKKIKIPLCQKGGIYSGMVKVPSNSLNISFIASFSEKTFKEENLFLTLASPKKGYFPFIVGFLLFGLLLWLFKRPYRLYVERMGYGGPPRVIEFKRKNDILWLGEKENERWIDLSLPSYSVCYKGKNKILLWKEGKEGGKDIPLNKWFSPEQDITLRFSKGFPKQGQVIIKEKVEDFYKL